jgi:glycosyltransferase involved in cell wall biosynthesis
MVAHSICMVGMFPPPTHGMAAVNLAMREFLIASGEDPIVFDLSAKLLSKAWHVRLFRGLRVLYAFGRYIRFLLSHRNVSVYLSLSAGYGQLYEIMFILAGRIAKAKIFLHHHSFVYLNEHRVLTHALTYLSGGASQHIALCNVMAQKLKTCYPSVRKVMILSNSAWLSSSIDMFRLRNRVTTLGFLGNIERDKGIFEFLDVVQKVQDEWHDVHALIAGPFRNGTTEKRVREKISELRHVQYVGAKYGAEKAVFLDSIDVLLFPTRNDAEPLTVLEAMGHGVPVVAWSRGCIPQMIPSPSGMVINGDDDYVSNAVNQIRVWQESPNELSNRSRGVMDRYATMQLEAKNSLEILYSQLVYVQ